VKDCSDDAVTDFTAIVIDSSDPYVVPAAFTALTLK
jgi:hypothetical protein